MKVFVVGSCTNKQEKDGGSGKVKVGFMTWVLKADSSEEARGKMLAATLEKYPDSDGWDSTPYVSVAEISVEELRDFLKAAES